MPAQLVIKVGQLQPDGSALDAIGAWVIDAPVWNQLRRVFTEQLPADTPRAVWIDCCDLVGDLTDEDPIIISPAHGQWLLRDWMKPQAREWKKIAVGG